MTTTPADAPDVVGVTAWAGEQLVVVGGTDWSGWEGMRDSRVWIFAP
ncbi:hypothetical protein [Microbacterium sp. GXF0217]